MARAQTFGLREANYLLQAFVLCLAALIVLGGRAEAKPGTTCWDSVQGKIAIDGAANKNWPAADLEALCGPATSSTEPGKCYRTVMSGSVDWGGGAQWNPANAIALCAGARDATKRILCFDTEVDKGVNWKNAIKDCTKPSTAASTSTVQQGPTAAETTIKAPQIDCTQVRRPRQCDGDGDGAVAIAYGGDDCDDEDAARHPGAVEVVDVGNTDEDCDPATFGDRDADSDNFVDARACNMQPGGGLLCGGDCNDLEPAINPHQQELPNGLDDNCNGAVDDLLGRWHTPSPR